MDSAHSGEGARRARLAREANRGGLVREVLVARCICGVFQTHAWHGSFAGRVVVSWFIARDTWASVVEHRPPNSSANCKRRFPLHAHEPGYGGQRARGLRCSRHVRASESRYDGACAGREPNADGTCAGRGTCPGRSRVVARVRRGPATIRTYAPARHPDTSACMRTARPIWVVFVARLRRLVLRRA